VNIPATFEVGSFLRSSDNRGTQKIWAVPGYAHAAFFLKISNLVLIHQRHRQTDRRADGQTDGRTTCNLNTALCTSASRGKKSTASIHGLLS